MSALASAAVEDVLSLARRVTNDTGGLKDNYIPCSTVICAVGGSTSGKTRTMFGPSIAGLVSSATRTTMRNVDTDNDDHNLGLFGEIISGILSSQQQCLSGHEEQIGDNVVVDTPPLKCSISILEIVNDDVLRDVLGFSETGLGEQGGTKALRVRYLDNRGAIVLNLHQETVSTMEQLNQLLQRSFKSKSLKRLWSNEGGHGHFIATITVSRLNGACAKIQLVDLSSPDRLGMHASTSVSVRKSLSALRGVLRGVLVQNTTSTKSPIPYRESTLTKLLQRGLEDYSHTRAIVIGTVSPSSGSYNQTLSTLDFMSRLFAKTGDTAQSPFQHTTTTRTQKVAVAQLDKEDVCNDRNEEATRQPVKPQSSIASHPTKAALKSITSDPRQRLSKLLSTAPMGKGNTKVAVEKKEEVNTPKRSSSVLSDGVNNMCFRDSYGTVFDQLDSLMNVDDDDVDRNSYGDDILEGLTPYKANRPRNEESSVDSSEGMPPSPGLFYENRIDRVTEVEKRAESKDTGSKELCRSLFEGSVDDARPPPAATHRAVNSLQKRVEQRLSKPANVAKSITACKNDSDKPKGIFRHEGAGPTQDQPPRKSSLPKQNRRSGNNVPAFVERPNNVAPLMRLPTQDSIDSGEPLVSSKGHALFFDGPSQKQKTHVSPPLNSVDVPNSPTFDMLESFKHEVDSLVNDLTSPHIALTEPNDNLSSNASVSLVATANKGHFENSRDVSKNNNTLEHEVASLKAKVNSLTGEKTHSQVFLSRIRFIMNEEDYTDDTLSDIPPSWPQTYSEVEDAIRKRQSLLVNLQSQLELSKAESLELSRELQNAENMVAELKQEVEHAGHDLVKAKETIHSQSHSSSSLETEIKSLKEQLHDLRTTNTTSSVFLGQLNATLGINNDRVSACDDKQQQNRLDSIKSLQSRLREGSKELKEALHREQIANNNISEIKLKLQNQMRITQESHNRFETKRLETEKLAEEAIHANEKLTEEITELQSKLVKVQNDHEALLTAHSSALGDSERLSNDYERMKTQVVDRDDEISRLKNSIASVQEEKTQLKDQLSSIKTKTVSVMKERIEGLRQDYSRRLEDFKAGYLLEQEAEGTVRAQLDLSYKKAENSKLRKRMEQIEKATSLKLKNAEERLSQVQEELNIASMEASTQRRENKSLRDELDELRKLMDVAEESVSELNRLKEENKQLKTQSQYNDHVSRMSSVDVPFEIRGERLTNDHSGYNEGEHVHERISALMRENEQNNISMRTLQVSSNMKRVNHLFLRHLSLHTELLHEFHTFSFHSIYCASSLYL